MSFDITRLNPVAMASDIEMLVQTALTNNSSNEQIRKLVDEYLKNKITEGESEGQSAEVKQKKTQEIAASPEYQRLLANTIDTVSRVMLVRQTERSVQQIAAEEYPLNPVRQAYVDAEERQSHRGEQTQPPAAPPPQGEKKTQKK